MRQKQRPKTCLSEPICVKDWKKKISLTIDDYYAKDGQASEWQGKGVALLNLQKLDKTNLRQLMAGDVEGYTRSSIRQDSKERIGIDLTFSAPKSVSIQALVALDERVVRAHDEAVRRVLELAEKYAQARKKVNGKSQVETTGNLIVAKFRHETSREGDPQLHTHAIVMNLTQRQDGRWRALRNDEILKATRYLGAAYRADLALSLQKLGYDIRHKREGMFELAHLSEEQLTAFSQRSVNIKDKLDQQGLVRESATTQQKQQATLQTRKHKVAQDKETLFKDWQEKARESGISYQYQPTREKAGNHTTESRQKVEEIIRHAKEVAATKALMFAVRHLSERQAVVGEGLLIDTAVKQGMGESNFYDVKKALKNQVKNGSLIRGDLRYASVEKNTVPARTKVQWVADRVSQGQNKAKAEQTVRAAIKQGHLVVQEACYTTKALQAREHSILESERQGRHGVTPLLTVEEASKHLKASQLNSGQHKAAELIVTTSHRIVGVQGFAGTGKSHMLKAVKSAVEAQGYKMQALAPYGGQVDVLKELGFKSRTLASFLKVKDKAIDDRTLIVIDEAGVVPTRLLAKTMELAERAKARVILIGDTAQTKAIEAGNPFDQLQKAGMQTAYMQEIKRQQNQELKQAVTFAAENKLEDSLKSLKDVTEIKDNQRRLETIAQDFSSLSAEERQNTLIVSGTNDSKLELNRLIRKNLKLEGQGVEVKGLIQRDMTKAESRYAKHYHIGDILQPQKDYLKTGLKSQELYKIEAIDARNHLTVLSSSGKQITLNPMRHQALVTYRVSSIEVSKEDVVRITKNDVQLEITNGAKFKVTALQKDRLVLTDGKRQITLKNNKPLFIDHAYASTVHGSQGTSAKRVLIDMNTKSLTTNKEVYYVAISRATTEAKIYTDTIEKLPEAIKRENFKEAALDINKHREK